LKFGLGHEPAIPVRRLFNSPAIDNLTAGKRSFADDASWPEACAPRINFIATLLTVNAGFHRLRWSRQIATLTALASRVQSLGF
jgi:hypothetical protein